MRITNYAEANVYLGSKQERPSPTGKHTRIVRRGANIAVRYHATDVVTYTPDGATILHSGGYRTVTTKQRMNEYSMFSVGQSKGEWLVGRDSPTPYADGLTMHADGTITGAAAPIETQAREKLAKRIRTYAAGFVQAMQAGEVPEPSSGDCWYCSMVTEDGQTLGEKTGNDHLVSHLEESYYVPSLLMQALKATGAAQSSYWAVGAVWGKCEYPAGSLSPLYVWEWRRIKQALVKYLSLEIDRAQARAA